MISFVLFSLLLPATLYNLRGQASPSSHSIECFVKDCSFRAKFACADLTSDNLNGITLALMGSIKVTQIAAASEEQSSASEQISKNVEAISNVTNESAAGIQQIARAAEDLNWLTENLQQLLGEISTRG